MSIVTSYREYSAIKNLIAKYFELRDEKKYDDFIRELTDILKL